jgi:hypothetical protein
LSFTCKHLRVITGGCDAFPEGIPDIIAEEGQEHHEPLPDQKNDIVFEPFEDAKEQ